MKIKSFVSLLLITQMFVTVPAFAKAKKNDIVIPKNFPAKYTAEYVEQITPEYKAVGKDFIFYVALDMLKGTNG